MKKGYDYLKFVIYGSSFSIILKAGFDFFKYKNHPDVYAYNSAPWYTGTLLWGALGFAVIIVCMILRIIIFKKMMKNVKIYS